MEFDEKDIQFIQEALELGQTGLGRVAPNPSVGCVIVKNGAVVGRGRTSDGGRPHAEINALNEAGKKAKGATAYVTLEPCSHVGKTGSCAQALIDAGVARVVVACTDPNPQVNGQGIQMLRDAGIEVVTGVLKEEALAANKGFFLTQTQQRPLITLKIATSANGKIAYANGESKWITGELARQHAHLLRSQHDAIAVGANTVLMDNPSLTTRLEGVDHQAKIIVFDRRRKEISRLTGGEKIFDHDPLILSEPDLKTAMTKIVEAGITRLMVEGGSALLSSFIRAGLYDEFYWYQAPHDLPDDGINAISDFDIADIEKHTNLKHSERVELSPDVLNIFKFK
jgi:diaminohydroxyphosphoribosylaminopyrimidine deaminase/5-amino-6-(5-phosphoribosylamino)uracil reductase